MATAIRAFSGPRPAWQACRSGRVWRRTVKRHDLVQRAVTGRYARPAGFVARGTSVHCVLRNAAGRGYACADELLQIRGGCQAAYDGRDTRHRQRMHFNAVYRAWRNAQIAASALIDNHGVHQLCSADNGVHGAGLNAFGAANALCFANERNLRRGCTAFHIQPQNRNSKQLCQLGYCFVPARWAFVDGFAAGNALCVGLAAGWPHLPH